MALFLLHFEELVLVTGQCVTYATHFAEQAKGHTAFFVLIS